MQLGRNERVLRQRWRRAGFEHLSRVDLWNFSFFFFVRESVREKLDGVDRVRVIFFQRLIFGIFFLSLSFLFIGRCEKIRWRGCWRRRANRSRGLIFEIFFVQYKRIRWRGYTVVYVFRSWIDPWNFFFFSL